MLLLLQLENNEDNQTDSVVSLEFLTLKNESHKISNSTLSLHTKPNPITNYTPFIIIISIVFILQSKVLRKKKIITSESLCVDRAVKYKSHNLLDYQTVFAI